MILSGLLFLLISYEKNTKIDDFMDNKTSSYIRAYNILYNEYKTMSHLIYMGHINTKDVKNIFKYATQGTQEEKDNARTELFSHLEKTYSRIKKFDIKQLHFHLPNNDSFLRFHRPNKYGDDLTNIRATVNYVNTYKKSIDGFEEGRIYNGYRFVFPLSDGEKHLGSVEISYSTSRIEQDFIDNYKTKTIFLINKAVVDEKVFKSEKSNYKKCILKDFYIEKDLEANQLILKDLPQETIDTLDTILQSPDSFSYYTDNRLFTFIRIKNPISENVVASFMIESSVKYIHNKTLNFYAFLLISNLLLLLALLYLYNKGQNKIIADKYTKEILSLNNNLENEVQKQNEEILHKLHFDALTGLLSRYSFFRDIEKSALPVVLLVDINKFQIINEVYGSDIGSKVLKKFATYLSLALDNESYYIYRLSADEFAIVDETQFIDPEKYELLISKLFEKMNEIKIKVEEQLISVDITIGLSTVENNCYESAKIALDYAKKYKKPYVMYSTAIDHRKESGLTLKCKDTICLAISDERVVAVYQPIVDKEGTIIKYETLMRLQEEDSVNLITPFYFLDVAFKTRLYEKLSSNIIFQALHLARKNNKTFSINFTYSDIKNHHFIQRIEDYFIENKDIASRIVFEITESESIENYTDVKSFIKRFRNYGVKIAIDDFGSGFSNFEYILEIEPDYLKIDGSLVKDIDTDTRSYILVQAIVKFSHKLGIKVIAEYVHSETIFNMLKELDVDEYQGFYFWEPLESIMDP